MDYEKETLGHLRRSLDEEEDETPIIHILQVHHKYLKEYIVVLSDPQNPTIHKEKSLNLFFKVFNMHAKAEESVFYKALKQTKSHDLRLEGLRGQDEHDLAFELINELKEMNEDLFWTEAFDVKVNVLTGLIKNHIQEEEKVMFPMAQSFLSESKLIDLTDDYLKECKRLLDEERGTQSTDVSMSDVVTLFY